MRPLIEVRNLTKTYKVSKREEGLKGALKNLIKPVYEYKEAVRDISFCIEEGELVGYIGANGAGKSTTIKMITGILTPTSGDVMVNGINPQKNRVKNNMSIGVVFGQKSQLWWDIPVIESFKIIKEMYQTPDVEYEKNIEYFKRVLDIGELLKVPVRQLSLGQKMRCELAATFIHNPKIAYLDEPTIGLDVMVKDRIREFIKEINRLKKTTIILTTHDLQDIESICSRVILIDKGMIVNDSSLESFKDRYGKYRVMDLKINSCDGEEICKTLMKNPLLDIDQKSEEEISVRFEKDRYSAKDILEQMSRICDIADLSIREPNIESIVKELYKEEFDG